MIERQDAPNPQLPHHRKTTAVGEGEIFIAIPEEERPRVLFGKTIFARSRCKHSEIPIL